MSDVVNPGTGEVLFAARMPDSIAQAIIAIKKQIKQLGVDERNQHAGYNYVSVDKFYATVGPVMAAAGLALLIDETASAVEVSETTDRDGKLRKTPWLYVHYALAFMHEDGSVSDPMRRSLAMPINGPQTYGAAQSYVEKQFLRQVFKVPTGEKDADEVAQNEDAPARGRPPSGNGAGRAYNRPQAAPPPTAAAAEVKKRWEEIKVDIDAEESADRLDLDKWSAFQTLMGLSAALGPETVHATRMQLLRDRAAKRRERLVGSLDPFDGR